MSLEGIQDHVDALFAGDPIQERVALIERSNFLSQDDIQLHRAFLQAYAIVCALEPLCKTVIDLGDGFTLRLNKNSREIKNGQLPGVRADGHGWAVLEGEFRYNGRRGLRYDPKGFPLWPLMIRNLPLNGTIPWEDFRPQIFFALRMIAERWPYGN